MNTFLQQRISALAGMPMGMAEGGPVDADLLDTSDPEVQQGLAESAMMPQDPNEALRQTIEGLMGAAQTAEDPTERRAAEGLAESAMVGSQAPMADMAIQLAQAGRGPDTQLAHVAPGEVILPPQVMADAEFEKIVGDRFAELDMNPEEYVVGAGIASLNPITGLEEFGWLKKTWKSVKKVGKKVIKPIAQVAQFIPGPWQAPAALIAKGYAAYDSFKAGNPLGGIAALGMPMPGGSGGGFQIPGFGGGTFSFPSGGAPNMSGGISGLLQDAYEYIMPGADNVGLLGNLQNTGSSIYEYVMPGADDKGLFSNLGGTLFGTKSASEVLTEAARNNPAIDQAIQEGMARGLSFEQILAELQQKGMIGQQGLMGAFQQYQQMTQGGQQGQQFMPQQGGGGFDLMSMLGLGGQGGMGGMGIGGLLGTAGLAGLVGKLAYDEAKDRKGVPLTPLTQMNAMGRYNIEQEIARRTGQPAPNPVEFGLLPAGTIPSLSGGAPAPMQARYGGPVMAFAEGGDVDQEVFVRMTGDIDGEGTEISDDIPAMLSDGEFVMTGRAVRGAGAFDMNNDNGIITLKPANGESREKGIDLMYKMMDLFSEFATAPQAKGA